jgi:uncharacterized membrane protein YidH (DUF202 family)
MSPGDPALPGLQAERTRLAWRRTTLAATAVALIAVSAVVVDGPTPRALVAVAILAGAWVTLVVVAQRRIDALGGRLTSGAGHSPAVVTLLVTGYALLAAILIL